MIAISAPRSRLLRLMSLQQLMAILLSTSVLINAQTICDDPNVDCVFYTNVEIQLCASGGCSALDASPSMHFLSLFSYRAQLDCA
eukprot:5914321-Pleurochrysis_carterae.AAC.1